MCDGVATCLGCFGHVPKGRAGFAGGLGEKVVGRRGISDLTRLRTKNCVAVRRN